MSGSFPLMAIAADFSLDYGDVLLLAHWYGAVERGDLESRERRKMSSMAQGRIWCAPLNKTQRKQLHARLQAHASSRWGSQ